MKLNLTVDAHVIARLKSLSSQSGDENVRAACRGADQAIDKLVGEGMKAGGVIAALRAQEALLRGEIERLTRVLDALSDPAQKTVVDVKSVISDETLRELAKKNDLPVIEHAQAPEIVQKNEQAISESMGDDGKKPEMTAEESRAEDERLRQWVHRGDAEKAKPVVKKNAKTE